jgi:hypothetical protein
MNYHRRAEAGAEKKIPVWLMRGEGLEAHWELNEDFSLGGLRVA